MYTLMAAHEFTHIYGNTHKSSASFIDNQSLTVLDLPEMKPHRIITLCILIIAAIGMFLPVLAQEDMLEEQNLLQVRPQIECPPLQQPLPAVIEAPSIQGTGDFVRAAGGIKFFRGNIRIAADKATYDTSTATGKMENVTFTTCTGIRPDYRIVAKEVTLLADRVRARNVSLYIGRLKVLALPALRFRVGGRGGSANIFPHPGYDRFDGLTLSQEFKFVDNDRADAAADLRLTTRGGIQGEIRGIYGIDGKRIDLPGRSLNYESLRSNALQMPHEIAEPLCSPEELRKADPARLYARGVFSLRQRTYDIVNEGLIVYRQPEFALRYLAKGINLTKTKLDPRLEIYPELNTSWGRFREEPGVDSFTQRTNMSALVALNVLPLGQFTAVQPVIFHNWASYETGDYYQSTAWAIDASHLTKNGGFLSARYIKRNESGVTPFQFDNIDVRREYQAGLQVRFGKHVVGLVTSYDADKKEIYEWEALYGYRTDCLANWVQYNSRIQHISFHFALINL